MEVQDVFENIVDPDPAASQDLYVPPHVIKVSLTVIVFCITSIINASLVSGVFPASCQLENC